MFREPREPLSVTSELSAVAAFKLLMKLAAEEIANGGEIKPARIIYATADPQKVKA